MAATGAMPVPAITLDQRYASTRRPALRHRLPDCQSASHEQSHAPRIGTCKTRSFQQGETTM
jgi:hypothetical protein